MPVTGVLPKSKGTRSGSWCLMVVKMRSRPVIFPSPRSKNQMGQATFVPAPFAPYLHDFFLAQPLLFFAVVDFLVAALGISPHLLRQENLTLFLAEVNEMRRTAAVRATKALDNYLCVGKGEGQRVELTFYALIGLQNEDALNPCVAKQVVNMPVKFFAIPEMPPQPPVQPVHCAARVDVTTCRESEDA